VIFFMPQPSHLPLTALEMENRNLKERLTSIQELSSIRDALEAKSQTLAMTRSGFWTWNPHTDTVKLSNTFASLINLHVSTPLTLDTFLACVVAEDRHLVKEQMHALLHTRIAQQLTYRIQLSNQHIITLHQSSDLKSTSNKLKILSTVQDITELQDLQHQLININTTLRSYVDLVDEYIITSSTNLKGIITTVSEAFCTISGYTKDELVGKPHNIVRHPDVPSETFKELWETLKAGQIWKGEIKRWFILLGRIRCLSNLQYRRKTHRIHLCAP